MSLEWKQVDLDAIGSDGEAVGELHLSAATKTKTKTSAHRWPRGESRTSKAAGRDAPSGSDRHEARRLRRDARDRGSGCEANSAGICGSHRVHLVDTAGEPAVAIVTVTLDVKRNAS